MNCRMCGRESSMAAEVFPFLCNVCLDRLGAKKKAKDYATLRAELDAAFNQASGGKGKERHGNNHPFEQQPILAITRLLEGHPCGALAFQVIKKTIEAGRLVKLRGTDAAVAEIYGAMNYAAAMAIRLKELGEREAKEFKHG